MGQALLSDRELRAMERDVAAGNLPPEDLEAKRAALGLCIWCGREAHEYAPWCPPRMVARRHVPKTRGTWRDPVRAYVQEVLLHLPAGADPKMKKAALRSKRPGFVIKTSWGRKVWYSEIALQLHADKIRPVSKDPRQAVMFVDEEADARLGDIFREVEKWLK